MRHITAIRLVCVLIAVWVPAGCSSPKPGSHSDAHEHTHEAPYGGELVELGDHAVNLEFIFYAAKGTVDFYVLDAHAENYIRLAAPSIAGRLQMGAGDPVPVEFNAVANELSGETVGNTSKFSVTAPELLNQRSVEVTLPAIEINGTTYTDVVVFLHGK